MRKGALSTLSPIIEVFERGNKALYVRGQHEEQDTETAVACSRTFENNTTMHGTPREEDATLENRERNMTTSGTSRETDTERELEQSANPIIVTPSRIHGILSEVAVLSMLGIFSFLGLLARLGLIAISSYSGQPTFSILWAQVVGCAIMGAVSERRADLEKLWAQQIFATATFRLFTHTLCFSDTCRFMSDLRLGSVAP